MLHFLFLLVKYTLSIWLLFVSKKKKNNTKSCDAIIADKDMYLHICETTFGG